MKLISVDICGTCVDVERVIAISPLSGKSDSCVILLETHTKVTKVHAYASCSKVQKEIVQALG